MSAFADSKKRSRPCDDDEHDHGHVEKRSRPTADAPGSGQKWYHSHHDSVLSTPSRHQPRYDTDDDLSSLVSEPGSPRDVDMSADDDDEEATLSQSPEDAHVMQQPQAVRSSPFGHRLQTHRVPTPTVAMRPGARSAQQRVGIQSHIRSRHPQEFSSDHLEVPSPIDEDEVPTPPSAAEAAGSQLSMLTVSDIDMEDDLPRTAMTPARPSNLRTNLDTINDPDSAIDIEPIDNAADHLVVRKQRQRSGALSNGDSPVRPGSMGQPPTATAKRGFSVGFRADCDKCRMRVPGHMNHFIA